MFCSIRTVFLFLFGFSRNARNCPKNVTKRWILHFLDNLTMTCCPHPVLNPNTKIYHLLLSCHSVTVCVCV